MKFALPFVFAIACLPGCRESPSKGSEYDPRKLREQEVARKNMECEALARRRIGYFSVRDVDLSTAIKEIQKIMDMYNIYVGVSISTNYRNFNERITLVGSDFTVASLADDLCRQIKGTWRIGEGKGYFLTFEHPEDKPGTQYSDDPKNYWELGPFTLPEYESPESSTE